MPVGCREAAAGCGIRQTRELGCRAFGHQAAAALACAGAEIDHVVGAADRILVMFDHHQGIALGPQSIQGVEQGNIVARMQADRGLIEHVAHAL